MNNQKLQELIKTEQRQILNYLTNVNVTGLNTYNQKSQTNTRIYDVNAERKTIWNLDTYTQKYLEFLQFMNTEFTTIYEEYKTNSGDIFTSHLFDNSEGNAKILEDYKEIYKANFKKEPKFNKTYPEEFVIQVQHICEKLASNYINSIERIIYYVDNIDELGKDYQKHIESYIAEKNEDWIRKYKPLRLDKKFSL